MSNVTYNEIERAEIAADALLKAIRVATAVKHERVSLSLEVAEDLHELLRDSLRLAHEMREM